MDQDTGPHERIKTMDQDNNTRPTLTTQLRALGNHVARIHNAIDNERPLAAKRFARSFARFIRDNSYSDLSIWNKYSGLDSYSFPGCYPLFYLDAENSALCPSCATKALADYICPAFRPVTAGINYEDTSLYCDQCSKVIESAYGDKDQDDNNEEGSRQ